MAILLFFAFLSGFVTVLSPCVLPVLPIVLSSSAASGKRRPLGVITGLVISFSLFTLLISQIVRLLGLSANTLRIVAVVIIGFLGLSMIIPKLNELVERAFSFLPRLAGDNQHEGNGFTPGFITGLSLGLIWAPCAGPILASVTALAATQSVTFGSALVVIAYAVGSGIPLLGIAYGGRSLIQKVPFLSKNLGKVQRLFGVVMILTAIAIALNFDILVSVWLTQNLPSGIASLMSNFETSDLIQDQIDQLADSDMQTDYFTNTDLTLAELEMGIILPNLGPAPDFTGIVNWINSEPLTLADLRGRVVLVDFWTYSCINCVRTLPYLTDWHAKYQDDGLVIVGVHTPEFAFEEETQNVVNAVNRFQIEYAVAQDNDYTTWRAYNNRFWPAKYFIDAEGIVRYVHFGEGEYEESELVIQQLLAEAGVVTDEALTIEEAVPITSGQTPELYIGYGRQEAFLSPTPLVIDAAATYTAPDEIPLHRFGVSGRWVFRREHAESLERGNQLTLHFNAKDVYLVLDSELPGRIRVSLPSPQLENQSPDIDENGEILIDQASLYHLVSLDGITEGTVTIEFLDPGLQVFAFTFGS
jgi:cytochrome c biogenesis protein CcdA/thiol-disulfide isomerase/thioredoxin